MRVLARLVIVVLIAGSIAVVGQAPARIADSGAAIVTDVSVLGAVCSCAVAHMPCRAGFCCSALPSPLAPSCHRACNAV